MIDKMPSDVDVCNLTRWAKTALGVRCAKRVLPILMSTEVFNLGEFLRAIEMAEQASSLGSPVDWNFTRLMMRPMMQAAPEDYEDGIPLQIVLTDTIAQGYDFSRSIMTAARVINGALKLAFDVTDYDIKELLEATHLCFELATKTGRILKDNQDKVIQDINTDIYNLTEAIVKEKWTNDVTVPQSFFLLRSQFDTSSKIGESSIIQIASAIELKAIEMAGNPEKLYLLTPREFEELIAEIFKKCFGFDVELTKQTRDGGIDIIAIRHGVARLKFLIECKRFQPQAAVGIGVVHRLHGVTIAEGANKGILATTGRISRPANEYITAKAPWLLETRDYEGIVEWLRSYQDLQMNKVLGIS